MELATERVPARRRGPVIVGLALLGILAVLVARPWNGAEPGPSPLIAALPSPPASPPVPDSASSPPTGTEPALSPSRAPTMLLLPTPDLAPVDAGGAVVLPAPPDGTSVRCEYRRRHGARRLSAVAVTPPTVYLDPASSPVDIHRIGWRFATERNDLRSIFDRAWQPVAGSRWQIVPSAVAQPAAFTPLTIGYDATGEDDTAAIRVRIFVEWYTRNEELAGQDELVLNSYREGSGDPGGPSPSYCRVVI